MYQYIYTYIYMYIGRAATSLWQGQIRPCQSEVAARSMDTFNGLYFYVTDIHDLYQWLWLQFYVILMMGAKDTRNM